MTSVPPDTRVTSVTFDPTVGATFAAQLAERALPQLDFDALREWLVASSDRLARATQLESERASLQSSLDSLAAELAELREDYQARITGMLKAIAIADRSRTGRSRGGYSYDSLESLADLLEALPTMPVADLVRTYRKTAACFRDHFPGSFALPRQ